MNARSNSRDNISFYSNNKKSKINNLIKKSQASTLKNVDTLLDSDEELSRVELENAVKNYKNNRHKHSETKCDANNEIPTPENNEVGEERRFLAENVDDSVDYHNDLQELMNYFRVNKSSQNKKLITKSYSDYEKQGAIPKRKTISNSNEIIQPKVSERNFKKYNKKQEVYFEQNQAKNKSFSVQPKISEPESLLENLIINPAVDDVTVKINDEIGFKPFFYIVPNNPSPNFFFSPGSYYVIPKEPNSLNNKTIFFHPEKTAFSRCTQSDDLLKHEKKLSRITAKHISSSHQFSCMNDLGKEVSQKKDSHLNIGPLDAELIESFSNLETAYALNKIYEKTLLNRARKTDFEKDKDDLRKNFERIQMLSPSLLEEDEKNLNKSDAESNSEKGRGRRQTDEKLTMNFVNSDEFFEIVPSDDENLFDGKGELISVSERQLQEMVLALPEVPIEKLREKLFEFQGDENLMKDYIQETKQVTRTYQRALDMLLIFPEADPHFLHQEVEKLANHDDNDDDIAINALVEELLDSNNYPKILENNLNSEKRSLWRKYVQNFSVKNFILTVSNPGDFAGPSGNHNQADMELILKFLKSRYPSQSRDFLKQSFKSNSDNLTKTCMALAHLETVRLSESSFQHEAFNEAFLKEICYIDHQEEIDKYLEEVKERKNLEKEEARLNDTFLSCPLCMEAELIASEVITCIEGHVFCEECIKRYILIKLGDGIFKFPCPSDKCDAYFSQSSLKILLPESVLLTVIKKQQAEEISNAKLDGLEFCPNCEFAYIPNPEDKIFKCQNLECLSETCRKCQEKNHIPFRCEEVERSIDVEARKKIEETMTEKLVRSCPTCSKKFIKTDGCNKMVCSCGTIICYICRKKIKGYDHFKQNSLHGKCPLYTNNEILHTTDVVEAGVQARNHILQDNPNIRIMHDPTIIKN